VKEVVKEAPHLKWHEGGSAYVFDEECDTCGETMEEMSCRCTGTADEYVYWCPECGTVLDRWYERHPIRPDMWKRPLRTEWKGLVAAACQRDGKVYRGTRHGWIIARMIEAGCEPPVRRHEQGFVTEKGVFLSREAAAIYAHEHGQTSEIVRNLTSEDLW